MRILSFIFLPHVIFLLFLTSFNPLITFSLSYYPPHLSHFEKALVNSAPQYSQPSSPQFYSLITLLLYISHSASQDDTFLRFSVASGWISKPQSNSPFHNLRSTSKIFLISSPTFTSYSFPSFISSNYCCYSLYSLPLPTSPKSFLHSKQRPTSPGFFSHHTSHPYPTLSIPSSLSLYFDSTFNLALALSDSFDY